MSRGGTATCFALVSLLAQLWTLEPVKAQGGGYAAAGNGAAASYADPVARTLHLSAMAARERLDESVVSYTAVVRQRIAAAIRMPLKDRTLYRSEASHRLWWNRDAENLVQVLAFREQTPAGVDADHVDFDRFESAFDPMNDRLFFGFATTDEDMGDPDGDDFWFEHPLYPEYVEAYRFVSGDTITLSLPDGRSVRAIELQVIPKVADVHRMTGALWIEPESGSLVRAVYRLSDTFDAFRDIPDLQEEEDEDLSFIPGMLKPWTMDISMISVDYALWDFEVWMPRSMRMEGVVAAGIIKAPVSFDYAYELESVTTEQSLASGAEADLPEIRFATRSEAMAYLNERAFGRAVPFESRVSTTGESGRVRLIYPEDRSFLMESPELPPPIWEAAPGFSSEEELRQSFDDLADLPLPQLARTPVTFRWGWQRPDLIRYNRVEGLSLGARLQVRPRTFLGPLSVTATARVGHADHEPEGRLDISRETLRRRITVSAYHEMASLDGEARHLGMGNSVTAVLFGRDDGDYYRRSGGALEWSPPVDRRGAYRLRAHAEYHQPVDVETEFALFKIWEDDWAFRPNLQAQEGWEYGGTVEVRPWWGSDPRLAQGGLDLTVTAATGDYEFVRGALTGTVVLPLPKDMRLALETGAGTVTGSPSIQRLWYVGGPRSLRGYAPMQMGGRDMVRGRVEIARTFSFGALSFFSDYAWAGDFDAFSVEAGYYSVGSGLSLVDGLLRLDVGYGLKAPRGTRVDFYLDAAL